MYKNKAQIFVEANADADPIVIEAKIEGYDVAVLTIEKEAADPIKEVPAEECRFLDEWLYSRTLIDQPWPDIDQMQKRPNFNFWTKYNPGRGNNENFTGLKFRDPLLFEGRELGGGTLESARLIHYIKTKVPVSSTKDFTKAIIHFEIFEGRGRVYLYCGDKRFFVEREEFVKAPLDLECEGLKPGDEVEVWAVLEANSPYSAINRPVRWMFK